MSRRYRCRFPTLTRRTAPGACNSPSKSGCRSVRPTYRPSVPPKHRPFPPRAGRHRRNQLAGPVQDASVGANYDCGVVERRAAIGVIALIHAANDSDAVMLRCTFQRVEMVASEVYRLFAHACVQLSQKFCLPWNDVPDPLRISGDLGLRKPDHLRSVACRFRDECSCVLESRSAVLPNERVLDDGDGMQTRRIKSDFPSSWGRHSVVRSRVHDGGILTVGIS